MVSKKEILEVAEKGMWFYSRGENRCEGCGEFQFTDKHKDDCPWEALLKLIEEGVPE